MAYGSSKEGGYGAETPVIRHSGSDPGNADTAFGAPALGKVQRIVGDVTITRPGTGVFRVSAGETVFASDLIETGPDGRVIIAFADGSEFRLGGGAAFALEELPGAETASGSALVRMLKGVFAFVTGRTAPGRFVIDTPVGRIQSRGSAVGIGSLTFAALTLGLIEDLKAASADIGLIDDGIIDYKDLKHGIYEVLTKELHPRLIVVEDPSVRIELRKLGSGTLGVGEVPNTPAQMAQMQSAYQGVFSTYSLGQQDPWLQQWLQGNDHANAQPLTAPGSIGSSSALALASGFSQIGQSSGNASIGGVSSSAPSGITSAGGAPAGAGEGSGVVSNPITVDWIAPGDGYWGTDTNWSIYLVPMPQDTVEINTPFVVTMRTADTISGLTIGATSTLSIVTGGNLTVANAIASSGLIQLNDPTLQIYGALQLSGGGTMQMEGPTAGNLILGVAGTGATLTNVDNTIIGSGTIGQGDGNLTFVNDAGGTVEATPLLAGDSGVLIIDTGNLVSNQGVFEASGGGTLQIEGATLISGGLITIDSASWLILDGTSDGISGGTLNNSGMLISEGIDKLARETVNNVGAGAITVNGGAVLIVTATTVTGGTVTDDGTLKLTNSNVFQDGTLDITNTLTVSGTGDTFTDEKIANTGAGTLNLLAGSALTFTGSSNSITGVTVTDDGSVTLGSGASLTLNNMNFTDGTGTATSAGSVTVDTGASLTLTSVTFTGGTLTLDAGSTLYLNSTQISDVTLVDNGATIVVTGDSSIDGVDNIISGTVTVDTGQTLTLDGSLLIATVTNEGTGTSAGTEVIDSGDTSYFGGAALITGGNLINAGTLNIHDLLGSTASTVTFDDVQVTNTDSITVGDNILADSLDLTGTTSIGNGAGGSVTVSANATLTLDDTSSISGGLVTVDASGVLTLAATSTTASLSDGTLDNSGTVNADGSGNTFTAETVDNYKAIDIAGSLTLQTGSTITNEAAGDSITVEGTGALTLDDTSSISGGTLANAGTVNVDGAITFTDLKVTTNNLININLGDTLTLNGVSISGGVIDDTSVTSGIVAATGDSEISSAIDGDGYLTVTGGTLTLSGDDSYSGETTIDSGDTLKAGSTTAFSANSSVTDNGTLDLNGYSNSIVALNGSGSVIDSGGAATLTVTGGGSFSGDITGANTALTVAGTSQTLTLSGDDSYSGATTIDSGDTLQIEGSITGSSGVTDYGTLLTPSGETGTVDVGTVTVESGAFVTADGGMLTITEEQPGSTNSGTIEAIGGGTLTINHVLTDNGGGSYTAATATNEMGGVEQADGSGSEIILNGLQGDSNAGTLEASDHGVFDLNVAINPTYVSGGGNSNLIEAITGGTFSITGDFGNNTGATIEAVGTGSQVDFSLGTGYPAATPTVVINAGTISASSEGTIEFAGSATDTLLVDNVGGNIAADDLGSTVQLSNVGIGGGTLTTDDPTAGDAGLVEIVTPASGSNTTFFDGLTTGMDAPGALTINAYVQVEAGAALVLEGTIDNNGGTIDVDSGASNAYLVIDGTVTLNDSGAVTLTSSNDFVVGAITIGGTLDNYSTIDGAGQIGNGGITSLTLDNESGGTIDATGGASSPLTVDTAGSTITNAGLMEATGGSTLNIDSAVDNSGTGSSGIVANGGTVDVDAAVTDTGAASISNNGVLEFDSSVVSTQTITFLDATGTLKIGDLAAFDANVTGPSGGALFAGDTIDLTNTTVTTATWNGTTLDINGTPTAFSISGLPSGDTFEFQSDGHSGTDLVVVPLPTITGTVGGQTTTSEAPVTPFSGVTISDANNGGTNIDTLTITYTAADGTLADGAGFTGTSTLSGSAGDYTLTGTAAAITGELDQLMFTPVNGVPNTSVTTTFTLSDTSPAYASATTDSTTTEIDSDPAVAPTTDTWQGPTTDDEWTTAGNWTSGVPSGEAALIGSSGTPNVDTNVSVDDVSLTNNGTITIGATASGVTFTLDDGTSITGGALTFGDDSDTLDVEGASGATLDNVTVNGGGAIDIGLSSAATLTLTGGTSTSGGTTVTAGALSIGASGELDVETGAGGPGSIADPNVILDDVTVTNSGAIAISTATTSAVLAIDDGTAISGGMLTIGSTGTLEIAPGNYLGNSGATLDDVAVSNYGTINVGDTSDVGMLTLQDGTTVSGGAITIDAPAELVIVGGINGGVTLGGVTVNNYGALQVDPNAVLTVANTVTFDDGGTVMLTTATEQVAGTISGDSTGVLPAGTFDNVDNVIEGTGYIGDGTADLTLNNSGTIDANVSGQYLSLLTGGNTIVNSFDGTGGTLEATNGGELSVQSPVDNTNGNISAAGGYVDFWLSVTGGNATISGGGTLEYGGSSNVDTAFGAGGGTLVLDHQSVGDPNYASAAYTGMISNFAAGDTIDLTDLTYAVSDYDVWTQQTAAGGTLQVFNNQGALEATLNLAGSYQQNEFTLAPDTGTGTEIEFAPSLSGFSGGTLNYYQYQGDTANSTDYSGTGYPGPQITNNDSTLTLTDGGTGEAGSWFNSAAQSIANFTVSFDYQATGSSPLADGFTFVLQNDPAGSQALEPQGNSSINPSYFWDQGGGLGYAGIANSLGVATDLFNPHIALNEDGSPNPTSVDSTLNGINLADPLHFVLSYNGSVLTETIVDLSNDATVTVNYSITLAQMETILDDSGTGTAYVGFTGADSQDTSTQTVTNFSFASTAPVAYWAGPQVIDSNGDTWSNPDNWTDVNGNIIDLPNGNNDVVVAQSGAYTLEITDSEAANSLTITAPGADVQDESGGSLAVGGALTIEAGTFSLIGGSLTAQDIYVGSAGYFVGEGSVSTPIDNDGGTVEAYGNLTLTGAVTGAGTFQIDSGNTLEFGSSIGSGTVSFEGSTGLLQLDAPAGANLNISGFTGSAPNPMQSDEIQLAGVWTQQSETMSGSNVVLDLQNQNNSSQTLTLTFDDLSPSNLSISNDGTDTFIFDPPGNANSSGSVSIGGFANDAFLFHPGGDPISDWHPQSDPTDHVNGSTGHNTQGLEPLIAAECHAGDAAVDLGYNIAGETAAQWHAHLASLAHLH